MFTANITNITGVNIIVSRLPHVHYVLFILKYVNLPNIKSVTEVENTLIKIE